MTLLMVSLPVLVTGMVTVDGWSAVTGTALSGDPALVPLTVGVPMVRWHEHPVSAGLVVVALTVLSPVPVPPAEVAAVGATVGSAAGIVLATLASCRAVPPVIAEVAAVTGLDEPDRAVSAELTGARTRVTGESDRVADPLPAEVAELVEPVPVVVADVVGVDADAEVVLVDAACRGCTSPDTSDVTVVSGLVPAVVSVAWLLGSGGPVVSSAWATPTPRSIKPPASNPAWMDRFTQVRMRNLSKLCWG
ncbi:hypothetical protein [Amycolatopsis sp. WAC 04182]|uniref:hypothetical protein n=1 Tax=Amycolatopsis sp. WAC 04182 TaxID=2203198 RepID=UPI0013158388|nr:hypothetical protein [Amycolatopsis sp. WAC 04182]